MTEAALVDRHTPLVWSVARRFFGRGVEPEDLFQLGCIGLLKALRGFDPAMEVQFSTYAVPKIAGEIRRFLRDDGPIKVSRSIRERAILVYQAQTRLEAQTGESPRISDLCRETGLSADQVVEALNAPREVDSLDAPLPGQERTLGETLPAGEQLLVDKLDLARALERLEPAMGQVIALRYLRGLTQAKTGALLGMTQVQVSRAEKRAMAALRESLRE